MEKLLKIFKKFSSPLSALSDRDIAIAALIFPVAFSAEYFLSRLQDEEISGQAMFGIWYILIALRFPVIYPISLSLAAFFLIAAGIAQAFNSNVLSPFAATASFGLIILAVIQLTILEWQKKLKKN